MACNLMEKPYSSRAFLSVNGQTLRTEVEIPGMGTIWAPVGKFFPNAFRLPRTHRQFSGLRTVTRSWSGSPGKSREREFGPCSTIERMTSDLRLRAFASGLLPRISSCTDQTCSRSSPFHRWSSP